LTSVRSRVSLAELARWACRAPPRTPRLLLRYAGTGGFRGSVRQPTASWWGWGADVYAGPNLDRAFGSAGSGLERSTYLDRFPREDAEKFRRRAATAQYPNHVATVVDIPLSYLNRKDMDREVSDTMSEWMVDVDGSGAMSWAEMMRDVAQVRAMVLGYCPVLIDVSAPDVESDEGEMSVARMRELGIRPNAIPMFPGNLYDWHVDSRGRFVWAKVAETRTERIDPLGPAETIERITIWTDTTWSTYTLAQRGSQEAWTVVAREEGAHTFGRVPIEVLRWRPVMGDPVRGVSAIESSSVMAKRMFNYLSELDEHIRNCVFAMLQVPMKDPSKLSGVMSGSGNAIAVSPDSNRDAKWVSPESTVAETLEARIKVTREEIYRQGRIEFTVAQTGSGGARSGVSRAFECETANRTIAVFASRVARFEERALELVSRALTPTPEDVSVTAPSKFAVEEMLSQLEETQVALDLDLGQTATIELKRRVVQAMLPNASDELLATILAELEDLERERAEAAATMRAATGAIADAEDEDEDEGEDDPSDDA